jgi:hypothetical protein
MRRVYEKTSKHYCRAIELHQDLPRSGAACPGTIASLDFDNQDFACPAGAPGRLRRLGPRLA